MNNQPSVQASTLDFIELSLSHLLCIVFPQTKSPYYKHATDVARQAAVYRRVVGEAGELHACAFDKGRDGAAQATLLLRWVKGWSGVQVFTRGRLNHNLDDTVATLICYMDGLAHTDPKANCLSVTENAFKSYQPPSAVLVVRLSSPGTPSDKKVTRLSLPCRRVLGGFRVEPEHPSSWVDQFQGATVRHSTDWCPLLDLSAFRQYD